MNHRDLCKVDMENGKESMTTFIPLKYDPSTNTTIVLCKPFTGRTHQIRIHLQFLGYPIVDDTLYNSREIWGENNGINGKYLLDDQKITENFVGIHNTEKFAEPILKDSEEAEEIEDENCFDCLHKYRDPTEQELTLHLHAIQYKFFDVKNLLGKYSHKNLDEKQRENFVKYSNNLKEKSSLFLPKTENGKMKFMKQILDCPTFILNTKIPEWAKTVQNVWKENYSFM
ncbi:hypothetical protein SNEBB_000852 [Seison nebaliae]|nr:hypothetical protein SNEBB_000852 [Seison nebaliae]